MHAYVGVTDGNWFDYLRRTGPHEEVNFWQPGGTQQFKALAPGELFLFKLKSPRNCIAGGGIFTYSTLLPVSLAWESFERANGAPSFEEMRQRIERYRRKPSSTREDYPIGCILLSQPFFLPDVEWVPVPEDWSPNIVSGKGYALDREPGASLFRRIQHVLSRDATGLGSELRTSEREVPGGYGAPVLVTPRLGQGGFRVLVTDAYDRRCAVTGEKVLPVLQASHIRPFSRSGPHRVQNGILLRSDLHTLFDQGYLTLDPDMRIEVSRRLHDDFENGRDYYAFHGRALRPPRSPDQRPAREFVAWHNENVYRG
jgi:putative restriction endonuclease